MENDSGAQLTTIPLLLLTVILWIWSEQRVTSSLLRTSSILGIVCVAIFSVYYPVCLIVVAAWSIYYATGLLQRILSLRALILPILAAVIAVLIVTVTGQIGHFRNIVTNSVALTSAQKAFYPFGLELLKSDLSAVWGFPDAILSNYAPPFLPTRLWNRLTNEFSTFLILTILITLVYVWRKVSPRSEKITVSVLLGGTACSVLLFFQDNERASAKAFTYVYPYLIFAVCIAGNYVHLLFQPVLKKAVLTGIGLWLVTQFVFAGSIPYLRRLGGVFHQTEMSKSNQFDLEPITRYLDINKPRLLLIDIPRTDTWTFAYYAMCVFSHYRSHFQSGLVVDNSTVSQNLWLQDLTEVPDYAVILKQADYIGPQELGVTVAETKDLRLYRIMSDDLEPFLSQERMYQLQEQEKPTL